MQNNSTQATHDAVTSARDVRAYARILLKYAPLIIGITLITTGLAIFYSFVSRPVYQAQVVVRINRESSSMFPTFESQFYSSQRDLDYFQTQIRLFRSPSLIRAMLAILEKRGTPYTPEGASTTEQRVNSFLKKIDVRAEPRTQLIRVIVEDGDAFRAKEYADLLADTYIREYIRANMETAKRFRDFYETSATNKAEEISVLEQGLREFKRMNKLDPKEIEALQLRQQTLDESVRLLQAERFSTNIPDEGRLFLLDQQIDMATNEAARLRAHIATLENLDAEYDVLSARLQTARNTYDYLLKLSEQSYVFAREFDPRNISIVDPASAPERPARPRRVINAFLGMVFGIILGVSVAFFAEYLDDTIKSPTDVETFLRMPFLGLIPALTKTISTALVENIVEQEPKGTVAEAYRAIRTNIIFSSDRPMRRLVITSSGPGEGKTTTAINIANVMARAGDRTLLIDADMRRPRIHKIFGLNGSVNGLSNYLVNNATTDNLFQPTRIEGLSVLTAGPIPPNPVELLNSPRLKELLDVAATQFDRIIIDTPPVIAVTDSAILSRLADAVILAVHGGRTHREVVKRAIDVLQNVGGRILGVLLNNVNIFRASYYDYYYYSYYRYAYGYKYGYTARRKGGAASRKAAASSKKT